MDFLAGAYFMEDAPFTKKKSRSFSFRDEIKLNHEAKNILFVEAQYPAYRQDILPSNHSGMMPFWEWRRHSFKEGSKFRTFMCAKGNAGRTVTCEACERQYGKNDARLSLRNVRYWPVIDLDWYYLNAYGSRVQPRDRAEERDFEVNLPKVYGKLGYLALGKVHHNNVLDLIGKTSTMCVGCIEHDHEKPGKVSVVGYSCKSCGSELEDIQTTNLNSADWRKFSHSLSHCPSCGSRDFPDQVLACDTCPSPAKASIYDLVLPLVKNGEGKDTSINLAFGESPQFVDDFEIPDMESGGSAPLLSDISESGVRDFSSLNGLYEPLDIPAMFADEIDNEFVKGVLENT
jgi:hypothetical protein